MGNMGTVGSMREAFVHNTIKTFEDAYLKVAAIPGDRMDSKDPVDQQRACREVFVETQKQLARVSASINAELYLWDETVNVKAKPVHYRQL